MNVTTRQQLEPKPGIPIAKPTNGRSAATRLLIVDDQDMCCAGLAGLFRNAVGIYAVAAANGADEAISMAYQFRPHVILMDVTLPNCGAFYAARKILARLAQTRIVFLDERVHTANVRESLRVGGFGYWTKYASFEQIAKAIRSAAAGERTYCPEVEEDLVSAPGGWLFRPTSRGELVAKLTPREMEVLVHIAQGLTLKECAERMGLSRSTVDNHKTRLMKKLGLHKSVDLVRFAIREGLVAG